MNIAVAIEPDAPPQSGERAAAFAAAARHSSLVRFLRIAILGGAGGTIAILITVAVLDPFGRMAREASVASLTIDGTKVVMDRPKLAGFHKDGRPYLVNAERAIQDVLHPTVVELRVVEAQVGVAGGGSSTVTAEEGVYDSANERMDLSRNVRVKSDQYDVRLQSANIDFKAGVYLSRDPVTVVTSDGATINADSISATDNGRQLVFDGHVRSVLQPPSAAAETRAALKGTDQ